MMLKLVSLAACLAGCQALSGDSDIPEGQGANGVDDPNKIMFAAIRKGHGKSKVHRALGMATMKEICAELDSGGDFKCDKVFGTGAIGTLIGGNNKEWLPDEVARIVKQLKVTEAYELDWRVAEDETLLQPMTKRKKGADKKAKHSTFAVEQQTQLFTGSRYGKSSRDGDRDRRNSSSRFGGRRGGDVEDQGASERIQHDSPIFLGALSAFAGGCEKRCNDPATFKYKDDGKDVTIYIVDGTVADHEQFEDMNTGKSRLSADRYYSATAQEQEGQTCAGDHGTHVGALAAGFEDGAGKGVEVVSVAVQPGCGLSGMASELAEGLDWVLDRHTAQPGNSAKPAIVSMSLLVQAGSAAADVIAEKVEELLDAGIVVVAAAGNYHEDACDFVPAGLPGVLTVAAADITHDATTATPWSWSNYGQCVDIWAPGVDIESASPDCFECTAIYSGTSQATPLVSGLVAAYLSKEKKAAPDEVKKALQDAAAVNVLDTLGHPYDTTTNFFAQVHM